MVHLISNINILHGGQPTLTHLPQLKNDKAVISGICN
jgi:hypothetical protein